VGTGYVRAAALSTHARVNTHAHARAQSQIYKFDAFSAHINRLTLLDAPFPDLAEPLRYFDKLRADNGSTFVSLVPVLRDSVMPLSMALEDHPTLFDAVDVTVNALAGGRILNDTGHLIRRTAPSP